MASTLLLPPPVVHQKSCPGLLPGVHLDMVLISGPVAQITNLRYSVGRRFHGMAKRLVARPVCWSKSRSLEESVASTLASAKPMLPAPAWRVADQVTGSFVQNDRRPDFTGTPASSKLASPERILCGFKSLVASKPTK